MKKKWIRTMRYERLERLTRTGTGPVQIMLFPSNQAGRRHSAVRLPRLSSVGPPLGQAGRASAKSLPRVSRARSTAVAWSGLLPWPGSIRPASLGTPCPPRQASSCSRRWPPPPARRTARARATAPGQRRARAPRESVRRKGLAAVPQSFPASH